MHAAKVKNIEIRIEERSKRGSMECLKGLSHEIDFKNFDKN
jgi:hypothetical protein